MSKQKDRDKEAYAKELAEWKKGLAEQRQKASRKLEELKKKGFVSAFDYLLDRGYEFE